MAGRTQKGGPLALVDCFLKLTAASQGLVQGEAKAHGHIDEIELHSFSFGAVQSYDAATARPTGKRKLQEFTITKLVDKATPRLMLVCANGEAIKEAVLTCRKAGREQLEYLKITMHNAAIARWRIHLGDSTALAEQASPENAGAIDAANYGIGDIVPFEVIAFACPKIEVTYWPQKSDGNLGAPITGQIDIRG